MDGKRGERRGVNGKGRVGASGRPNSGYRKGSVAAGRGPGNGGAPGNRGAIQKRIEAVRQRLNRQLASRSRPAPSSAPRRRTTNNNAKQEAKRDAPRPRTAPGRARGNGLTVNVKPGIKWTPAEKKQARPPKFKPTGVKGKQLSQQHYQKLLSSRPQSKTTTRRFTSGGGTTMVGHDFLGTLTITSSAVEADVVASLSINPVDLAFPALTVESQLHQQYVFENFAVHMVRSGTDFLTGDMLGWYDRDPDEALPPGIEGIQVGYFKDGTTAAFKDGHTWRMPRFPGLPVLYTRDLSSDERLVNQAQFNLQIVNPPAVFNGGEAAPVELNIELWASYACKFMVKDITFVVNSNWPRNLIQTAGASDATFEGKTYGGIFLQTVDSSFAVTDVKFQADSDYLSGTQLGLPGFFFGYSDSVGGTIIGQLAGYGYNSAKQFSVNWATVKGCKLACEGWDTSSFVPSASTWNCTVGIGGNDRLGPYAASSGVGTNAQLVYQWKVTVTDPGELTVFPWSSADRLFVVGLEGQGIQPLPYDATRNITWAMNGLFVDTGTATASISGDTQRLGVYLETYINFGMLSPALKPGPATIEGLVKQKFKTMTNDERWRYKGDWQEYLRHVREQRRPKPKPLPDYLQADKKENEEKKERKDVELQPVGWTAKKELTDDGGMTVTQLTRSVQKLIADSDDEKALPSTPASRAGSLKGRSGRGR